MTFEETFFGRPNTIRVYTSLFRTHIRDSVNKADFMNWNDNMTLFMLGEWQGKQLSRRTQITLLRLLSRYLKFRGAPTFEPRRFIKSLERGEQQQEIKALTAEEARRMMDSAASLTPDFYPILLLGMHAGLRAGEVFGLRCGDIDMLKGRIRIAHSYDGPTKSGKTRFVPISTELSKAIFGARNLFFRGVDEVIFERFDPNPTVRRLCASAKTKEITFHGLRHTFASLALEGGVSPKQVQLWLGHADLNTTLSVYWNLIKEKATLDFLP